MKSLSNETLNAFLQKVLSFLHFGSWQNCMSSANLGNMQNVVGAELSEEKNFH